MHLYENHYTQLHFERKHVLVEEDPGKRILQTQKRNSKYLRQASQGVEYMDNEVYYVLRFTPADG